MGTLQRKLNKGILKKNNQYSLGTVILKKFNLTPEGFWGLLDLVKSHCPQVNNVLLLFFFCLFMNLKVWGRTICGIVLFASKLSEKGLPAAWTGIKDEVF